jgi:DNA polymerase
VDRALEAEAKALLRAARAHLEELVEEELAWTRTVGPNEAAAAPRRLSEQPRGRAVPNAGREAASEARSEPKSSKASEVNEADSPTRLGALAEQPSATRVGDAGALARVRAHLGECTRCPLHAGRKKIVFGDGNPSAELMFVGEGPGEQEDLSGLPFVGRAGELLTQMIEAGLKIPRASVYIANVVKCRPPNNRTPLPNEVAACREFLDGQIDAIRPKVIVALGKPATSLLLGRDVSITRVRGSWHDYRGFPVMPTFHPAFLLRQYTQENRRLVWEDLKAALERSRG